MHDSTVFASTSKLRVLATHHTGPRTPCTPETLLCVGCGWTTIFDQRHHVACASRVVVGVAACALLVEGVGDRLLSSQLIKVLGLVMAGAVEPCAALADMVIDSRSPAALSDGSNDDGLPARGDSSGLWPTPTSFQKTTRRVRLPRTSRTRTLTMMRWRQAPGNFRGRVGFRLGRRVPVIRGVIRRSSRRPSAGS